MKTSQRVILLTLYAAFHLPEQALAFHQPPVTYWTLRPIRQQSQSSCVILWAKGFGNNAAKAGGAGGGFGSTAKPKKPTNPATLQKKIAQQYGGSSARDVAMGTQKRIEEAMNALPPHLRIATQLYQKLKQWDTRMESLSILQQASIPPAELEGAKRAREELERIYAEHGINENDLHNVFQKITWDASADAKAARSITGDMPKDIANRVQKACNIIGDAVTAAGKQGRCLDVGCGFGVLVPFLQKAGVSPHQIYGVDISAEMVRNAQELHPGIQFKACDFLSYGNDDKDGFDGIVFCASLHDMPDMVAVLKHASSLLRVGGKLVLSHPQGASHVLNQSRANPILVKRGLPDSKELKSLNLGLQLTMEPFSANTAEESTHGYLAVLEKFNT